MQRLLALFKPRSKCCRVRVYCVPGFGYFCTGCQHRAYK